MVNKHTTLIALLALLSFSGCQKDQWDDCFTSKGPTITQERCVDPFHTIELDDHVDLVLTEEEGCVLQVTAGQNLLGQVDTDVEDGVLHIRDRNSCNWVRSLPVAITVTVPSKHVNTINYFGTGNISSTATIRRHEFRIDQKLGQGTWTLDLDVDTCYIGLHTGAGDVIVTGSAHHAFLYSGIQGPIDATGLTADVCHVNNSGRTDIRCRATVSLEAQIYGTGDILYAGSPLNVYCDDQGGGELIRLE